MSVENDQSNNNTVPEPPANLQLPIPMPLDDVRLTDEIPFSDKKLGTAEHPTVPSERLKGTSFTSQGPKHSILNEYPAKKHLHAHFSLSGIKSIHGLAMK